MVLKIKPGASRMVGRSPTNCTTSPAQALVFLEEFVRWFEYTFEVIAPGDMGEQLDILWVPYCKFY